MKLVKDSTIVQVAGPCRMLDRAPARQQADQQQHECDDENNVNQVPRNAEAETEQPQDQQHHQNCPQHKISSRYFLII